MSKKAAVQLLRRAAKDSALQQELEGALQSAEGGRAAFLQIAKSHGFDFTEEEFTEVLEERRELADEELEEVAGGLTFTGSLRTWVSWGYDSRDY